MTEQASTKVFISYSRKDMGFADGLARLLDEKGFEVLIDRQDIKPGEPWEQRIYNLINQADTVIFLITTHSVRSPICNKEVAYADGLNKRFIPLLREQPVDQMGQPLAVPKALSRINYINVTPDSNFQTSIMALLAALKDDLEWVREHTRLGELALRWQKSGEHTAQLLRGKDLGFAEEWLRNVPRKARQPSDLHYIFITQSRRSAKFRQRSWYAGSAALLLATIIGGTMIYWEQKKTFMAEQQQLAKEVQTQLKKGDIVTAALLAIEAVPEGRWASLRKTETVGEIALYASLHRGPGMRNPFNHSDEITMARMSVNGKWLATASKDRTARLWDVETGRQHTVFSGHFDELTSLALSFDGTFLITGSKDRTARLWNTATGQLHSVLIGHGDSVTGVSFDRSGERVLTVSKDGTARVWETSTGRWVSTLKATINLLQPNELRFVGFVRNGSAILMVEQFAHERSARLWDFENGKIIRDLAKFEADNIEYGPNGKRVVVYESSRKIWLADALTGKKIVDLRQPGSTRGNQQIVFHPSGSTFSTFAVFSPDGSKFATHSENGPDNDPTEVMRIWDARTGHKICGIHIDKGGFSKHFFSSDGERIFGFYRPEKGIKAAVWDAGTCQQRVDLDSEEKILGFQSGKYLSHSKKATWLIESWGSSINLWNAGQGKFVKEIGGKKNIRNATLSPDGRHILSRDRDGELRLWKTQSGRDTGPLTNSKSRDPSPVFNADGSRLLVFGKRVATLWNMKTRVKMATLTGGERNINGGQFSRHDNNILITYEGEKFGRVWSAHDGKVISFPPGQELQSWNRFNSPDGKRDVRDGKGGTTIYSVSDGKSLARIDGYLVSGAALSGDNTLLLTTKGKTGWLHDFRTGRRIGILGGHRDLIYLGKITHDGARVLTAGLSDRRMHLWNGRTGEQVNVLEGHARGARVASFSKDGTRLVTGARDALFFDAGSGRKIAALTMSRDRQSIAPRLNSLEIDRKTSMLLAWDTARDVAALWEIFPGTQELVDHVRWVVPRCLTRKQREKYHLSPAVPQWCYDLKKWPYNEGKLTAAVQK